ncbi:MAG: RNA polymerase sigma-70 factor [Saprospiraceae bacterium]|nr:RNA polymerase sigma-70 factor [Saprospiraceae bacterium]
MKFVAPGDEQHLPLLQEQAAAGDTAAFRQIFLLFFERLQRFAFSIIKSEEGAVEVTDDVFVKLWRNKQTLPDIKNLRIYLYAATKNNALNYLSSQKSGKKTTLETDFPEYSATSPSPEQILIMTEMMARMEEAVGTLPPKCRIIFNMVREDGLKYKEVAEILHISVNTVDAQMVIAVARIREQMKDYIQRAGRTNAQKKSMFLLGSFLLEAVLCN